MDSLTLALVLLMSSLSVSRAGFMMDPGTGPPPEGGLDPNVSAVDPNVVGVDPNVVGVDPNVVGVDPNMGIEDPFVLGVDPNMGIEDPLVLRVEPPVSGVEPPVGGGAEPPVGGVDPTVTVVEPPVVGGEASLVVVEPIVRGVDPPVGGVEPTPGGVDPPVGGSDIFPPSEGGVGPDFFPDAAVGMLDDMMGGGTDPLSGGVDPTMGGADPTVGGVDPPVGGVDPPVGGVDPPVGGVDPPVGGVDPPIGGADPLVGGTDPLVGGTDPPVGGEDPLVGGTDTPVGGEDPLTIRPDRIIKIEAIADPDHLADPAFADPTGTGTGLAPDTGSVPTPTGGQTDTAPFVVSKAESVKAKPKTVLKPDRVDSGAPDLSQQAESPFMAELQRRLNTLCAQRCKTALCYLADTSDCRNFITCQEDALGMYHATLQPCAFGTYWAGQEAQRKITCDVPSNVQCSIDYCAGKPEGAVYDHLDGNCKTYWQCQAGKPVPKCCKDGEIYSSERDRCVADRFRRCHNKCPIKIDECRLPETKTEYYDDGNCRTYWNCEDQRPHPLCCPKGQGYDVARGCIPMATCDAECPKQYEEDLCLVVGVEKYSLIDGSCRTFMKCNALTGDERWCCASDHVFDSVSQSCVVKTGDMNLECTDECPAHYNEECHLRPDPDRPDSYMMVVHGVEMPRPCPAGTEFNFSKCGCATPVKSTTDNSCNKELDITFDDPTWYRAGSQKEVIITEHGAKIGGPVWQGMKSYRFDGNLYYRTPFFQSQYINLYIKVVYMPETNTATGRQVILSNCMNLDLGAPSMELYLKKGRIYLDLVTDNVNRSDTVRQNRPVTASVPYTPKVWNNLTAVYDGYNMYLLNEVQGAAETDQQPLTGPISVAAEGLDFGGCYINKDGGEGYIGSLAHLEFSKCLKREWLENVSPRVP